MDNHKRILGILYIVMAGLQIFALLILSFILNLVFGLATKDAGPEDAKVLEIVSKLVEYGPILVIVFLALPGLIAGIGLLAKKEWALIVALVIGCLHLLAFPFGTALGIYTIWIYSEDRRLAKANPVQ
jgi:hypothetical protein